MAKEMPMDKTSPITTAENIYAGFAAGTEEIFPDPMSTQMGGVYAKSPKELETTFAAF
jgi:hypothetical protein